MTPEQYRSFRELFDAVVDLPAPERAARLHELGATPAVVTQLLAHIDAGDWAPQWVGPSLISALAGAEATLAPGDVLGVWRIEGEIGRGGMGRVYRAVRTLDFDQTAALKVLALPSSAGLEYFTRERQLLAHLNHPNIARLLDGGATPDGKPFLVMELVDGLHIDKFCAGRPVAEVLGLFEVVCAAVAAAHRQLIVHCDLKPSNILIETSGRPVLLDFGIATMIAAADATPRAYTPRYASPEQQAGGAIGTTSDVYSLGVLLGELVQPAPHTELSAIVGRATAADPAARYASVDALADELRRGRSGLPVFAHSTARSYVARKFLVRHWPWAAAAGAFLLTIAGFTLVVSAESRRAQQAERSALAERERALAAEQAALAARDRAIEAETSTRQTADFLVSVFEGSNPQGEIVDIPAAALLAQAEARLASELQSQPARQSEIYGALGRVYANLNDMARARAHFERAIAIERRQARPLMLAKLLHDSAVQRRRARGSVDATSEAREAYALRREHAGVAAAATIDSRGLLADILSANGEAAEALPLLVKNVELEINPLETGPSVRAAAALEALGNHHSRVGHHDDAIAALRRGIAIREALGETESITGALGNLGRALSRARRHAEAETVFRRVLAANVERLGADSPAVAWSLSEIGRVLTDDGRGIEALALYTRALAIMREKRGAESVEVSAMLNNIAFAADQCGDMAAAEAAYAEALRIRGRLRDEKGVANLRHNIGAFRLRQGNFAAAHSELNAALAARVAAYGEQHPLVIATRLSLIEWSVRSGDGPAALRGLEQLRAGQTLADLAAAGAERQQALASALIGNHSAAIAGLERAEAMDRSIYGENDPRYWTGRIDRAELLAAQGDGTASRALAAEILAAVDHALVRAAPARRRLRVLLGG